LVVSDNKPKWGEPNLGNCTSVVFTNLLLQVRLCKTVKLAAESSMYKLIFLNYILSHFLFQAEAIASVDYKPSYNASELLIVLGIATKGQNLNGGDLSVSVQILQILTSYNNNTTKVTSDSDQQNFLEICSNILESTNSRRWIQYEDQLENVCFV